MVQLERAETEIIGPAVDRFVKPTATALAVVTEVSRIPSNQGVNYPEDLQGDYASQFLLVGNRTELPALVFISNDLFQLGPSNNTRRWKWGEGPITLRNKYETFQHGEFEVGAGLCFYLFVPSSFRVKTTVYGP